MNKSTEEILDEIDDPSEVDELSDEHIIRGLRNRLESGQIDLDIRETPFGTNIGLKTGGISYQIDTIELRMIREFISRYEDFLVDLHDIEAEGVDLWWAIGEQFTKHGLTEVNYSWLGVFGEPVGIQQQDFEYADKIHDVFDDRGEIPNHRWNDETWVGRLADAARTKEEAISLIETFEDKPSKRDIRLWKDVREMEAPGIEEVLEEVKGRYKEKYGYTTGTWVKKTQLAFELKGMTIPEDTEIEAAIDR